MRRRNKCTIIIIMVALGVGTADTALVVRYETDDFKNIARKANAWLRNNY